MSSTKHKEKSAEKKDAAVNELPLPEDKLRQMHREMLLIRRFEEKTGQQYQMKKFSSFCHLY